MAYIFFPFTDKSSWPAQRHKVARPLKTATGIGLALRGNVAVSGNAAYRVGGAQRHGQTVKRFILRIGKWHSVTALQFNTE